jgi:hypothetical protein
MNSCHFTDYRPIMLFCVFFALILTFFVHNVSAIVSYDWKDLLDIRTMITNLDLEQDFQQNTYTLCWRTYNHCITNWTSSVQVYPINRTWRTVISGSSWLNKGMENIHLAAFSMHWLDQTAVSSRERCVPLSTTAVAQSLRKSQGSAHRS